MLSLLRNAVLNSESSAEKGHCCKEIMKRYVAIAFAAVLAELPATVHAGLFDSPAVSSAHINMCSNVSTIFSYFFRDQLNEGYGFFGRGTFRIPGETDESKQPDYNLTQVACDWKYDDERQRKIGLECKVTRAGVSANPGTPNAANPSCFLDVDVSTYDMKEIARGIFVGVADGGNSTSCYNPQLTLKQNTKRVLLSFELTQYAAKYDAIAAGTCGKSPPRQQALMNCTGWVAVTLTSRRAHLRLRGALRLHKPTNCTSQ